MTRKKSSKRLGSKGFSHVELTLLIVVIAVIAGVGFFVYSKNNNKSKADSALKVLTPAERQADYQGLAKLGTASTVTTASAAGSTKAAISSAVTAAPKTTAKGKKTTVAPKPAPAAGLPASASTVSYPANNPSFLYGATVFNYPVCNTKDGTLASINWVYSFTFNQTVAQPAVISADYFMTVKSEMGSKNLILDYIGTDGSYVSKEFVVTGKDLNSTVDLTLTAVKYKNIFYAAATPGNIVLANDAAQNGKNPDFVQKIVAAPSKLKAGYAAKCKTDYDIYKYNANKPAPPVQVAPKV